ncbi:MAG: hypothetical protein ACYC0X_13945 [Pirellulaceae bacterium]
MRAWLATALLASSWLFGLGYFDPVSWVAWLCALMAAVLLLGGTPVRFPQRVDRGMALLVLLPALWIAPPPYKGMPVLLFMGLAISLLPVRHVATRILCRGSVLASMILLPQSLVLWIYQSSTARSHELPNWLARPVALWLRVLGADATLDRSSWVLRDTATTDRIAATWELLLDPATLCLVVGGVALLAYGAYRARTASGRGTVFVRGCLALLLVTLAWMPLRLALLVSLVVQQQLRADAVAFPNVGQTLVSTWVHAGFACGLAILLSQLLPLLNRPATAPLAGPIHGGSRPVRTSRRAIVPATVALAVLAATFVQFWTPVGARKANRVMFVERHSTWEPTTEPYRTEVYGEAGSYNYAAIYEYCDQFYDMSRLLADQPISRASLEQCDILIIKTPTSRYAPEEIEAVVAFVQGGGSLLMIGDHTNVFNMNTYLNDISRHFGFTFRNDLLFRIGDPYKQTYRPPSLAHPILQHVPPMGFAVSCSIDPGSHVGSMVIRNVGLWSLPPAYQESNYHPQAEYRPSMQYGAWCQLWSTTSGRGRVLAFADSTLFSNFCVYQPGKTELFMGMLEWLNHTSPFDAPGIQWLLNRLVWIAGGLACAVGFWTVRASPGRWMVLLAATWGAWAVAAYLAGDLQRRAMPLPVKQHAMQQVVIDRTVSTVPLFSGAFAEDPEGGGYGLLEQWVPRIGNYTARRAGTRACEGDGLIVICPTLLPTPAYRDRLVEWVRAGGRLVVFDTPDVEASTANSLLMLFGLTSVHNAPDQPDAPLRLVEGPLQTPLQASCEIQGGEPLATWGPVPIAARIRFGAGSVTAIGFGSLFNDASMGYHWLQEPDETQSQRYEILYALLRAGLQAP